MVLDSAMHNPNPRVIEMDHLIRRGSNSSMMSADSHGRRFTQPYLREVEEDYAAMSPTAPPRKKQRFNTMYVPASPPMRYIPHYADPRFVQQLSSVNGPPVSATGHGPGPLSRPTYQHQQDIYHPARMQPPPRPSISYSQAAPIPSSSRDGGLDFDESLRLPPLQAQIPNSPSMNSEASAMTATTASHVAGLGIMHSGAPSPPPSSRGYSVPPSQRPQWLYKLDMLRAISPPLMPPAPGIAPYEIRGPIVALEGASPSLLKEIAAVIEKCLSASGECAVRIWTEQDAVDAMSNKGEEVTSSFTSPVARFQARMLRWHRVSEELVNYIAHEPLTNSGNSTDAVEQDKSATPSPAVGFSAVNTASTTNPTAHSPSPPKLPVAVLGTGYSLTITDHSAASLHIDDAYQPDDHWRWFATMWRGIVGQDLTIYVKQCTEEELKVNQLVDFANSAVLVVNVPERKRQGDDSGVVDQKLERRLGFEIMEWVRSRQFGRRSA